MYCESCRNDVGRAIAIFRGKLLCRDCLAITERALEKTPSFFLIIGNKKQDIIDYCAGVKHENYFKFCDVIYDGARYKASTVNKEIIFS